MVEKTGHKRQLQTMRMEWINEGKPRSSVHEDSIFDQPSLPLREGGEREKTAPAIAHIFQKTATDRPKTPVRDGGSTEVEMDDLYDATPKAPKQIQSTADSQNSLFGGGINASAKISGMSADDGPPEDDLDALLAEEETIQAEVTKSKVGSTGSKAPVPPDDSFDDDMEAMAEMDGLW